MSKRFSEVDGVEEVLNKCPLCGAELEYNALMQYSNVYKILKNGTLSKNRKEKRDCGSMECGFICCTKCDFHTNCDLDVEDCEEKMQIFQYGEVFMYEH